MAAVTYTSQVSDQGSHSLAQTSLSEEDGFMCAVLPMALEQPNLPIPQQAEPTPVSAFFRRRPTSTAFVVPRELKGAAQLVERLQGLLPPLLLYPQRGFAAGYLMSLSIVQVNRRAAYQGLRCSGTCGQDRKLDVTPSACPVIVFTRGQCTQGVNYILWHIVRRVIITRELGRTISFLVQALFQVWLCQSGLTEASRRTRQALPVEPGALFGPCA